MDPTDRAQQRLWHDYRMSLRSDPSAAHSLRVFCAVGVAVTALFIPLEYFAFPNVFGPFLGMRLAAEALMIWGFFWGSRSCPLEAAQAVQLGLGTMIATMITLSGDGVAADYGYGLILIWCILPHMAPLSARQFAVPIVPALMLYLILPQWVTPVDLRTYALHAIFPTVGLILGVCGAYGLDRIRFAEYMKRVELERARDELKELDAAKSRFTANVHHELRTPLTLILSPLEAMLVGAMGQVPGDLTPILDSMRVNGLRLLKLINNLLDLSRLESRKLEIRRVRTPLAELIGRIVNGARPMAERKHIDLRVESDAQRSEICVDPDAMEKILVNLLGNALKFTEAGGNIEIGVRQVQGGLRLRVSDTGIGIPRAQLTRVFERFAQVDNSDRRQFEGSGIGLSLVRDLVALHGGSVWAESEGPGRGTQIYVELPFGEPDAAEPEVALEGVRRGDLERVFSALEAETLDHALEHPGRAASAQALSATPERGAHASAAPTSADTPSKDAPSAEPTSPEDTRDSLLIVEDNADMRELLRALLAREFRIRLARNGFEGLEAIRSETPLVVLADVTMPGMSGLELTSAIKQDSTTAQIPVILVTSKAEREMRAEGLELGADDYITKPFHPRELLARVRTLARVRGLQAVLEQKNASLTRALRDLERAQSGLVQREKMAALGRLLSGITHEINNPVSFIRGNVDFLETYVAELLDTLKQCEAAFARHPELEPELLEHIDTSHGSRARSDLTSVLEGIREGAERTSHILRDLRTFARLDRGEPQDMDLSASLDSTLNLLRPRWPNVEIVREYAEPAVIACLAGQLNQVFMHLLANAADAVGEAGRIVIRTGSVDPDHVFVEIEDDGTGIEPEILDRIYDPFFTTKEVGKGTGLGLSVSHEIIARHAGTLSVKSEPGSGTRVRIEIPCEFSPAPEAPA